MGRIHSGNCSTSEAICKIVETKWAMNGVNWTPVQLYAAAVERPIRF
jgi:hypothetical protein